MLAGGVGIRDTAAILEVSSNKALKMLASSGYEIEPQRIRYDTLEIDEFWTYLDKKKEQTLVDL